MYLTFFLYLLYLNVTDIKIKKTNYYMIKLKFLDNAWFSSLFRWINQLERELYFEAEIFDNMRIQLTKIGKNDKKKKENKKIFSNILWYRMNCFNGQIIFSSKKSTLIFCRDFINSTSGHIYIVFFFLLISLYIQSHVHQIMILFQNKKIWSLLI